MNYLTSSQPTFRNFAPERVYLEPEDFETARQISQQSQQVAQKTEQRLIYNNVLAFKGMESWSQKRNISFNSHNSMLWQTKYAAMMQSGCLVNLGEFRGCLISLTHLKDSVVKIPKVVLDLPEYGCHYLILVEVDDEEQEVIIRGILRSDHLQQLRTSNHLSPTDQWNYEIPISWFNDEPNRLRFDLAQLNSSDLPLTASQPLKDSPDFLSWLQLKERLILLTQPAINTATWLHKEIDALTQSLGASPAFAYQGMCSDDRFNQAILGLRSLGLPIPTLIEPFYHDGYCLEDIPLRLCTVAYPSESSADYSSQKWSFLVILGTKLGDLLPSGFQLRVSNLAGDVQSDTLDYESAFLYVIFESNWSDKLAITIIPPNESPITLTHPFTFQSEAIQ